MSGKLDMTPMYVMHNALRRELRHIAAITARSDDDPRRVLRTAIGWNLFKKALHAHHGAEDVALWPVMRQTLADRPADLELLAAMEREHDAIDPLIDAIDTALTDRESDIGRLGDLSDALVTGLSGHLKHEESQAIPLIQATVTEEQLQRFGQAHGERFGADAPRILPWMLDGADAEATATMLAPLPEPARMTFQNEWLPAYSALDLWSRNPTG